MLANYQIKRSDSNNFGNLNNDYSRFSDNNMINMNQKNQQMQNNEYNSNHRNNNNSVLYNNNTFEAQNEYGGNDYNNIYNENYQQQTNDNRNSGNANFNNNNNRNFNLRINTINSTNRSSDFTNDKSVLVSPHFNQLNNQNIMSGLVQYQQNSNNNINSNAIGNVSQIEGVYSKLSDRETPYRKGNFFLI